MSEHLRPRQRALLGRLGRPGTYRRATYALLSAPSGLVYWLVLLGALLVDILASVPRLLRGERPWLRLASVGANWRRLAGWERRQTMRALGVELAPFDRPPSATLALLLLKLPLGYPVLWGAAAVLVYAGLLVALAYRRIEPLLSGAPVSPAALPVFAGAVAASLVLCAAVVLLLDTLATLWGKLAALAYDGESTRRQLREARARAAVERANAERAEQSRRELIMNVGHELRTPAASIRGHVESLQMLLAHEQSGQLSDATLRANLAIVQREAERLGLLIDELLALSRNETDRLRLDLAPLDAAEVVDEVFRTLAPLARRERQITLLCEVEPGLPPLLADRRRLLQVVLNLVRNALAYTPAGGMVALVLRRDGDAALVAVRDTGIGIPAHELERIFERFHRVDAARARSSGGFGLGLAIVRDLVDAMGGTVTATSVVGDGSSFEVRLPFAVAAAQPGPPGASAHGA